MCSTLRGMIVRRARLEDREALCVTAMRAFVDDPVMRWLFPEDEVFLEPGGEVFRAPMTGWIRLGEVLCSDDGSGVAAWIPPGRPEIDFTVEPPARPPSDDLLERFALFGTFKEEHTPAKPHWYLQLFATHPDWQRRGIGATLLRTVYERASADGLACYLETETVANVAYYRHHGFEVRSEWDVPTGPHMWGMYRPPT